MPITVGAKIPSDLTGFILKDGGPTKTTLGDLLGGKKVVLFGIPGAFTPTCTNQHLPSYIKDAGALQAKGVNTIICLAVNDVFVLDAWNKAGGDPQITMLSDGNGDISRALGLDLDLSAIGLGTRSKRFAMIVDQGTVTALEIEEKAGQCTVSSADHILTKL